MAALAPITIGPTPRRPVPPDTFLDTEGGQVSSTLNASPFGVGIVVRSRAFVFQLVVLGRFLSRPPWHSAPHLVRFGPRMSQSTLLQVVLSCRLDEVVSMHRHVGTTWLWIATLELLPKCSSDRLCAGSHCLQATQATGRSTICQERAMATASPL